MPQALAGAVTRSSSKHVTQSQRGGCLPFGRRGRSGGGGGRGGAPRPPPPRSRPPRGGGPFLRRGGAPPGPAPGSPASREQWLVPARSGSSHGKVSMSRTPGEVLKRALTAVAGVLVALTVTAALAHPAGAAGTGGDVLAATATRT